MSTPPVKKQCEHCPWKKSTVPDRDIPGGYSRTKHCALKKTIAKPGEVRPGDRAGMACHKSSVGAEKPCVGWVVNQLGVGNNIGLRLQAMRDERFQNCRTDGPQHQRFEDTLGV